MSTCPPPYRPFLGAPPPHFVDRADAEQIGVPGSVATSLAACLAGPADPRFHQLVVGAPELGKTAQARAVGRLVAGRLGWVVSFHRCGRKERAMGDVADQALAGIQRLCSPEARRAAAPATDAGFALAPYSTRPPGRTGPGPRATVAKVVAVRAGAVMAELREFFALAGSFAQRISRGLMVVLDDADRLGGAEVECAGHLARGLARDGVPVAFLLTVVRSWAGASPATVTSAGTSGP